jgi:hypothetical protein
MRSFLFFRTPARGACLEDGSHNSFPVKLELFISNIYLHYLYQEELSHGGSTRTSNARVSTGSID